MRALGRATLGLLTWGPILMAFGVVILFAALFLATSLPRLWAPYSLEWMESHIGRHALRVAQGLPLYPRETTQWMPYMYSPLYSMALGGVFRLATYELGWGRALSLGSTLFMILGMIAIIREHTKQWLPALLCSLLFFAFFRPSGYWYDLVRPDMMAMCLFVWGAFFMTRRPPSKFAIGMGILLLGLATLTKQTIGPAAILLILWPALIQLKKTRLPAILVGVLFLNAILVYQSLGNERFIDFTVIQPRKHLTTSVVLMPGWKDKSVFISSLQNPDDKVEMAKEYFRRNLTDEPAWAWSYFGENVWLLGILLALWPAAALLNGVLRRKPPAGMAFLLPCAALIWGGFVALAKYGGFVNNFVPCFLALCILLGFAVGDLRALFPRGLWFLPHGLIGAIFLAQLLQPWDMPPMAKLSDLPKPEKDRVTKIIEQSAAATRAMPGEPATPEGKIDVPAKLAMVVRRRLDSYNANAEGVRAKTIEMINNPKVATQFRNYLTHLDGRSNGRERSPEPAAAYPRGFKQLASNPRFVLAQLQYQLNRLAHTGLFWYPSQQIPVEDSAVAYKWLVDWLKMKRDQGQSVWIGHHQWYGSITGHPTSVDLDMVRAAQFAGVPNPESLAGPIKGQSYDWLILDSTDIEHELTTNKAFLQDVKTNYDPIGVLPIFGRVHQRAMQPVTGSPNRPYMLYRAKRLKAEVGDPEQSAVAPVADETTHPSVAHTDTETTDTAEAAPATAEE